MGFFEKNNTLLNLLTRNNGVKKIGIMKIFCRLQFYVRRFIKGKRLEMMG